MKSIKPAFIACILITFFAALVIQADDKPTSSSHKTGVQKVEKPIKNETKKALNSVETEAKAAENKAEAGTEKVKEFSERAVESTKSTTEKTAEAIKESLDKATGHKDIESDADKTFHKTIDETGAD